MAIRRLPVDNHVVRHIRNKHLMKDESGKIIGIFPDALGFRPDETYLSTCWLEYFPGDDLTRICAVRDRLSLFREVKQKDGLGVLNVGKAQHAGEMRSVKIRILNEPKPDDQAYSAIRGIPRDDQQLLELLAANACTEVMRVEALHQAGLTRGGP